MFKEHNSTIYELFLDLEGIDLDKIDELEENARENGEALADLLVEEGIVTIDQLMQLIAEYLNYDYSDTVPEELDPEMMLSLDEEIAKMYGVVPYTFDQSSMTLMALDPFNFAIIDDLAFKLQKDIVLIVADPNKIQALLVNTYGSDTADAAGLLDEIGGEDFEEDDENDIENMANQTPIIKFVNLVLQQAIRDKASDIHFEPYSDSFRIRYRIDGSLYEMAPPPKNLTIPIISRLKVIANLNITERRIPQDGRIKMTIAGHPVDLRVSSLPTQFGESVVLRVLDKGATTLDLDKLNVPEDISTGIRAAVRRPNGIFIVTGPTGSGKTTTLYSALKEVNTIDTKILTAEDPIEYEIEGLVQIGINHSVGLDFPRVLRAFLRQDPDKIMVGEIRDIETAKIAVQASLTGHVVLSTLHTNDASGAVTRLVDMGLEPFLIASALELVLAQRLVRRICKGCSTSYDPDQELLEKLELEAADIANNTFYFGTGCDKCSKTGYKGRVGLFEMIAVNDAFRELITSKAPTLVMKQKAIEIGMRPLREDGIKAMFNGFTTLEEVLKYT